jgi:hypothetical protein
MDDSQVAMMESIGEGMLSLVSIAFPPAAPFILLAEQVIPALIAAQPFIDEAVKNGRSAIEAGEAASPGFKAQIGNLLGFQQVQSGVELTNVENAVRTSFKLPAATDEQISAWGWDDRWKNDANSGG